MSVLFDPLPVLSSRLVKSAEVRSDVPVGGPSTVFTGRSTFDFDCDGPGWNVRVSVAALPYRSSSPAHVIAALEAALVEARKAVAFREEPL